MKFAITALSLGLAVQSVRALPSPKFHRWAMTNHTNDIIPNKWIVVYKEGTTTEVLESHVSIAAEAGNTVHHTFDFGDHFRGYTVEGTEQDIKQHFSAASFESQGQIAFVEPDRKISIAGLKTEDTDCWGLHRISHRAAPADGKTGPFNYTYDDSAGEGTWAYIVDSGVQIDHPELEGRAEFGASFVRGEDDKVDNNGHGTHVAGTVASKSYGVARKTRIVSVKVLNGHGSGSISGLIAGMDWALKNAQKNGRLGKAIMNISITAQRFSSTADATMLAARALVKRGFFIAAAAGNDNDPASAYTPAAEQAVCTVAAMDNDDKLARFSNWGDAVDIAAPGVDVLSSTHRGGTARMSGTSMASPHVCGIAALILGKAEEGSVVGSQVCGWIQSMGVAGRLKGAKDKKTKDLIAQNQVPSPDGKPEGH